MIEETITDITTAPAEQPVSVIDEHEQSIIDDYNAMANSHPDVGASTVGTIADISTAHVDEFTKRKAVDQYNTLIDILKDSPVAKGMAKVDYGAEIDDNTLNILKQAHTDKVLSVANKEAVKLAKEYGIDAPMFTTIEEVQTVGKQMEDNIKSIQTAKSAKTKKDYYAAQNKALANMGYPELYNDPDVAWNDRSNINKKVADWSKAKGEKELMQFKESLGTGFTGGLDGTTSLKNQPSQFNLNQMVSDENKKRVHDLIAIDRLSKTTIKTGENTPFLTGKDIELLLPGKKALDYTIKDNSEWLNNEGKFGLGSPDVQATNTKLEKNISAIHTRANEIATQATDKTKEANEYASELEGIQTSGGVVSPEQKARLRDLRSDATELANAYQIMTGGATERYAELLNNKKSEGSTLGAVARSVGSAVVNIPVGIAQLAASAAPYLTKDFSQDDAKDFIETSNKAVEQLLTDTSFGTTPEYMEATNKLMKAADFVTNLAPYMLAPSMGLGKAFVPVAMFATSFADSKKELYANPKTSEMSDDEINGMSAINAAVNTAFMEYGLKTRVWNLGDGATAIDKALYSALKNVPRTMDGVRTAVHSVLASGATFGALDAGATVIDHGLKGLVNLAHKDEVFDTGGWSGLVSDVIDRAATGMTNGAFLGGITGMGRAYSEGVYNRDVFNYVDQMYSDKQAFGLAHSEIRRQIAAKEITSEEALNRYKAISTFRDIAGQIPKELPVEDRYTVSKLLLENTKYEAQMAGLNEAFASKYKEKIDDNNKVIKEIADKSMADQVPVEDVVVDEAPAGKRLFNDPNPETAEISKAYKEKNGIIEPDGVKIEFVDTDNASKIADAYEALQDAPNDPEVQDAYKDMADETAKQHQDIIDAGYEVELWEGEGEPYANAQEMIDDVKNNKHMYVFSTEKGFGETPITEEQRKQNKLLQDTGFKDKNGKVLLYNDLFRFVHDFFGHTERGNGFGPVGEENAWDVHARMYTPKARRAMTTETRGQNSWVNFGPQMRGKNGEILKKGDEGYLSPKDRAFAPQKMGLLPEEFSAIRGAVESPKEVGGKFTPELEAKMPEHKPMFEALNKGIAAVKSILPNIDVRVHSTHESMQSALDELGAAGDKGSRLNAKGVKGNYFQTPEGSIRIDLNLAAGSDPATAIHELTHAVLFKAFGDNPKFFDYLKKQISSSVGYSTNKKLKEFVKRYGSDQRAEEYLAELSAILKDGEKIEPNVLRVIAEAINKIIGKITGGKFTPFEDVKNTNELIKYFSSLSESLRTGSDVNINDKFRPKEEGVEQKSKQQAEKFFTGEEDHPKFDNLTDVAKWLGKWSKKNKIVRSSMAASSDKKIIESLVDHTKKELSAWEDVNEGYEGFYDEDIPNTLNPSLKKWAKKEHGVDLTDDQVSLYHILSSFASPSATPVFDSNIGLQIFDKYLRTGELSAYTDKQATVWASDKKGKRFDTGEPKVGVDGQPVKTQIAKAYAVESLNKLKKVIDYFNGDIKKAVDWVESKHSYDELSEVMGLQVKGLKSLSVHENLSKENGGFGVFAISGPKLGSYILNRVGEYGTVTKDLWYARTMARLFGEPLIDSNGEVLKSPWATTAEGNRRRKLADKAWEQVADELGTKPAIVQQRMWDFEKKLWQMAGAESSVAGKASDGFARGVEEVEKGKSKQSLVDDAKMTKHMTEDEKGNYLFYHYSPEKIPNIDPRHFGKNLKTGRDERPGIGVSMYYTRPDVRDVGGSYGYVVRVPKDKVYPFNSDPINLMDKAKAEFEKMYPGQAFDKNKQVAFVSQEAAKLGYDMTVAKWGDNLRAQTTKKMKGETYEKPHPEYHTSTVFNPKLEKYVANEKKGKSKQQLSPDDIRENMDEMFGRYSKKMKGRPVEEVVNRVIDEVQHNWVKEGREIDLEEAIRSFKEDNGIKAPKAPSQGKISGEKPKKVAVTERTALKDQIKLEVTAAREGAKSVKDAVRSIADNVSALVKSGTITSSQAASLTKRLSRVNIDNPDMVDRYLAYAEKVFDNADYDAKLSEARSINSKIKRSVKSNEVPLMLRLAAKEFIKINPTKVSDIEAHIEMGERLFDATGSTGIKSTKEGVSDNTRKAINIEELYEYTERVADEIREQDEADLANATGIDITTDVEDTVLPSVEDYIRDRFNAMASSIRDMIKSGISPIDGQKHSLTDVDKINLSKLVNMTADDIIDPKDKVRALEAMDHLLTNGDMGRIPYILGKIKMAKDVKSGVSARVRATSGKVGIPLIENAVQSIRTALDRKGNSKFYHTLMRNSARRIDNMIKNYEDFSVFNNGNKQIAQAESKYTTDINTKNVDNVRNELIRAFKGDVNKTIEAGFKITMYLRQLEHDSNPGSKKSPAAIDFVNKTIEAAMAGNHPMNKRSVEMLEGLANRYTVDDQIDANKIYESMSPAEKKAIAGLREFYDKLTPFAEKVASEIHDKPFVPFENYTTIISQNTGRATEQLLNEKGKMTANVGMAPSGAIKTKAGQIEERTGSASPIDFDPFATANRALRDVMLDYHMTIPLRTMNKITRGFVEESAAMYNADRSENNENRLLLARAMRSSFEEVLDATISRSFFHRTIMSDVSDYIRRTATTYMLGSPKKAVAEFGGNLAYVAASFPEEMALGTTKYADYSLNGVGGEIMYNSGSYNIDRAYPHNRLTGAFLDPQSYDISVSDMQNKRSAASNKATMAYYNILNTPHKNLTALTESMMTSPDLAVIRPVWFGSMAKFFKKKTGKEIDFDAISNGDANYMDKYKKAIEYACDIADRNLVDAGASRNPWVVSPITVANHGKLIGDIQNYMSNFGRTEYEMTTDAIIGMHRGGKISREKAARQISGALLRAGSYTAIRAALGTAIAAAGVAMHSLITDDEKDESPLTKAITGELSDGVESRKIEANRMIDYFTKVSPTIPGIDPSVDLNKEMLTTEKNPYVLNDLKERASETRTWDENFIHGVGMFVAQAALGRNFGNVQNKFLTSTAFEYLNSKYMHPDGYNRYKDNIMYSSFPDFSRRDAYQKTIESMSGPYGKASSAAWNVFTGIDDYLTSLSKIKAIDSELKAIDSGELVSVEQSTLSYRDKLLQKKAELIKRNKKDLPAGVRDAVISSLAMAGALPGAKDFEEIITTAMKPMLVELSDYDELKSKYDYYKGSAKGTIWGEPGQSDKVESEYSKMTKDGFRLTPQGWVK